MKLATFQRLFWPVSLICAVVFVGGFYFGIYVANNTLANLHQFRCGTNCTLSHGQ